MLRPESWAHSALTRGLIHLLFAAPCMICDGDDGPICQDCREEMTTCGDQCPRCGLLAGPWADLNRGCSDCRGRSQGYDEVVALGSYQGPIREICLHLKKARYAWLSRWASDLMLDVHGDRLLSLSASLIVPVPLHWSKRVLRGYNQSQAIAETLSRRLKLPVKNALTRTRWTKKQAGRGKTERKSQMQGAFRAVPNVDLKGKTVILVDDILTTGSTCGASARALKKAGAKRVIAAVLARAEGWA